MFRRGVIEHPNFRSEVCTMKCPKCGNEMVILGVDKESFKRIFKFRCPECGYEFSKTIKVKIRSTWEIVTFRCERDVLSLIDKYAAKHKMTRSEVIREALEMFVRSKGLKKSEIRVRRVVLS